jgi:ubiquinone/menaquinone biosynthesis C-methylase UbiE
LNAEPVFDSFNSSDDAIIMLTENQDIPLHAMSVYESRCPLTRNLFFDRLNVAIDFSGITNSSNVLDVGIDTGQLLKKIRSSNNLCGCYGIDIEPSVESLQINDCKIQLADVQKLPFSDSFFDVVFALDVLEHVREAELGIREIRRVLKTGGFAILSGPTESWFYKLCRFIQFGVINKNIIKDKSGFRGQIDYHFHTVYEIEELFLREGFKRINTKLLPRRPMPTLFRVTKFQK